MADGKDNSTRITVIGSDGRSVDMTRWFKQFGEALRSPMPSEPKTTALPLDHEDIVERVAVAIEETLFAPYEFPLDRELHAKYRMTAREAIAVVRQWDVGK